MALASVRVCKKYRKFRCPEKKEVIAKRLMKDMRGYVKIEQKGAAATLMSAVGDKPLFLVQVPRVA